MSVSCRHVVGIMKRHLCRHCGLALESYAALRSHLESHPSENEHSYSIASSGVRLEDPSCAKKTKFSCKCEATFERWNDLRHHVRTTCRLKKKKRKTFTCDECGKNFVRRDYLSKHVCVPTQPSPPPPPPLPAHHPLVTDEDPVDPPELLPFPDALSTNLLDVVREHWSSIRTCVARGPLQSRYNYRLTTLDTTVLEAPLRNVFQEQTTAFKINLSYAFVLRNKNTDRYRYYHASCNCCGRYLDEPSLIANSKDFDEFLERIREADVLQWAINQRPDSAWVCELVTNATFFVNRIIDHPIGCVRMIPLPVYIKKNKAVVGLEADPIHGRRYGDNLCLFRCLALQQGCDVRRLKPAVKTLYETYAQDGVPMEKFAGVSVKDLYRVETVFRTNVCVYSLVKPNENDADERPTAELIRRSICKYPTTLYLNLHETHFSFISDVRMYCHSYRCRTCNSLWKRTWNLRVHESTCSGSVRRVFPGGVYHSTPSIFEQLDDENIRVNESLRYYPYRATFDFECWFDTEHLPSDSEVRWIARHVPLSVSVASNVPGHERVTCLVTNGDSNKLMIDMMAILMTMSNAAYDCLKDSYENVMDQLVIKLTQWDEQEETTRAANDKKSQRRRTKNPYKKLMWQLYGWMRQLPVIGFNSGQYDLNVVKQFLVPYFLAVTKTEEREERRQEEEEEEEESGSFFVIKRNNTFMCLSTDQLKFLDMTNYLAPGFSYAKYLKAYGCEVTKGHFPYEYMDRLEKLDDTVLPPKEAFFSRLKNEGISDEDYVSCQEAWCDNGMSTLRDFLVWYNNRDVVPFLQAVDRQFDFYQQRGIDMFKQGISVPGLTLLYLFNDLPEKTYFTIFNEKHKDLHDLVKDNICGGPSIIFHRYHEKGVTTLRQNEHGEASHPCQSIVGYDANALYLWSLMQDMPTGWYTRRRFENDFRPESAQLYGQMASEWLTWESERTGLSIRHQTNGREKRIGKHRVDGWCSETKTAYQFQGCFFHGCSCNREEVNSINGKTMTELLVETRKTTAYLRHFVKVVELWECEWKKMRREPHVKRCLDATFPRRRRRVQWTMTQQQILSDVRDGTVFGMIECDICVPEELRDHFVEMQPVFKNISLVREDLGPFMRRYAEEHNIMTTPRRMLVGSYYGNKILLATPLLQWYLDHGLEVLHVYQIVEYDPIPCFRRFGDAVSEARRAGDVHSDKTIIADTMKLLGNSGYGKTITNVDRHRDVNYCAEKAASRLVNNRRFRQLDVVVDDAYEIEMSKRTVTYALPIHVGFFVLQYAKMRMLQFYYDFIDRYVERPLFQYCEMDTDSAYLALAAESVDVLVTPALREHYFRHRSEWLPSECCDAHRDEYVRCRLANRQWIGSEECCKMRRAFDKRTPGLFKVEWSGDGFVGLCSKTYYCFGSTDKYSTKGLSKRHNTIDKETFLEVLTSRRSGSGKNRGFRVYKSTVMTYVQERAALTYFYAKRVVHEDGLSTGPTNV